MLEQTLKVPSLNIPRLSVLLEQTQLANSVHGNARQAAKGEGFEQY